MINDRVNGGFPPQPAAGASRPTAAVVSGFSQPQAAAAAQEEKQETARTVASTQLEQAVDKLNQWQQSMRRTLSFRIDESTGRTIISVYDAETDELIRQIPPEDTLRLAEQLVQQATGSLLRAKA